MRTINCYITKHLPLPLFYEAGLQAGVFKLEELAKKEFLSGFLAALRCVEIHGGVITKGDYIDLPEILQSMDDIFKTIKLQIEEEK